MRLDTNKTFEKFPRFIEPRLGSAKSLPVIDNLIVQYQIPGTISNNLQFTLIIYNNEATHYNEVNRILACSEK